MFCQFINNAPWMLWRDGKKAHAKKSQIEKQRVREKYYSDKILDMNTLGCERKSGWHATKLAINTLNRFQSQHLLTWSDEQIAEHQPKIFQHLLNPAIKQM